jgi:thiol-disulfide isomerase/thioredoxin
MTGQPKSRFPSAAVGLLALFAAGCQPGGQTASEAASKAADKPADAAAAKPAEVASLASFKTGDLKELDLSSKVGVPASSFLDAEGKEHTLAEFKGKVLVVNIWGEWCAPCVEEMPTLAKLQKAFPGGDVAVVPIAFGYPNDRDKAAAKLKTLAGADLPFFYDSSYNVSYDLKTGIFPSTVIFNKDGKEVARLEKNADWSSDRAEGLIRSVLAGKS